MSLVGNFTFNNYDRTAGTSGVGSDNIGNHRQSSHTDIEQQQGRRLSLGLSLGRTGRRSSNDSTLYSGRRTSASGRQQETPSDARVGIPKTGNPTGFHDNTYFSEGTNLQGQCASESEKNDMAKEGIEAPELSELNEDIQARRDKEIADLARSLTRQSTWSQIPDNPLQAEKGSNLDPNSSNFRARAWTKSMIKLINAENKNPGRTAGVAFRNLNVHGFGAATDYQADVGNIVLKAIDWVKNVFGIVQPHRIDILRDFDGLVMSGEMLIVLGPPGSGCSTFLKTLTGETHGFVVDEGSYLNYQGIPAAHMHDYFRGEAIYTAEVDVHFPMLTVGDTLTFAAKARAPKHVPGGVSKNVFAQHMRDVMMATFGISHTVNTRVGNDFVRGVSGGERKRVSIAEAALSGAPLQAWDNSTRGLDSANAIEFCKTLRLSTELGGTTALVAIYQAPQSAYDIFDKAIVLYEGRQIYFGSTTEARGYFERMGFVCPDRQTDADFLTSMTSAHERVVAPGMENRVPRTPDEFAAAWKASPERAQLLEDIEQYNQSNPIEGDQYQRFAESRRAQQAKYTRPKSPYTLSYKQQVELCLWRGFRRLVGDPSLTFTQLFGNFAMALVLGSVFYNMQPSTHSFFQRGAVLFFAIILNAFGSALEILTLYAQRPIVEKHSRYALYHPSAEAFASMLTDMPYKIMNAIIFNTTLYFMVNLNRQAGNFFFFLFVSFLTTLMMSMLFRTIASVSRTLSQAMAPAAILILAIVMFTGFVVPTRYMLGWCRWINYIDPIAYAFEALMVNEFHGRTFHCSQFIPSFGDLAQGQQVCSSVGSAPGQDLVSGDAYISSSYGYDNAHKWRNVGIIIGFMVFLMVSYLTATEFISSKKSKGEVLVFRRGQTPASLKTKASDEETANNGATLPKDTPTSASKVIQKQTSIFSWKNVCYDVQIKAEKRRILDHVDGWVKPGTLTALMGVSGAGKTTLLDVLATRVTMGVISGEMLVDGQQRDSSFQRKTGYVQQQDLHLQATTVREALNFSAILRQRADIPRKEKLAYVDEVIQLLDMGEYADAVVGVPGEGLNVEQRKRLTIGVELAAKPELLLFLDEPSSGLDSQTSWAILDLLEKLARSGQAILCTIHQPSAMLFQRFDRLLFLAKGGRTVYFGEVGEGSNVLTHYFERNGAHKCPPPANPAEWMLEVIGAAPGTHSDIDWHQTWRDSPEYLDVQHELDRLRLERPHEMQRSPSTTDDKLSFREFAAPFGVQLYEVTHRVFQQYWRTPSYIYSKLALCLFSALFIGLVFLHAPVTQQGLQNQMFSIFMLFTIFGQLVQQIMPNFVTQRSLYEARERPSRTYSWQSFIISNVFVEIPWNSLMALVIFICFYYPIGLYRNAEPTDAVHERGALFFLFTLQFLIFTSTFTSMVIAGIADAETGGNIANLMFSLCLIFCGVLAPPQNLPGFWIFMYRVSPFTYLVNGMLSVGVAHQEVTCADNEYVHFDPPLGDSCMTYMQPYIDVNGGYLQDPNATVDCGFCTYSNTDVFLSQVSSSYSERYRNFGILWAFIVANVFGAILFYWLARVPKNKRGKQEKSN